jgi:outer membrane receptor protein involved in Fe transport
MLRTGSRGKIAGLLTGASALAMIAGAVHAQPVVAQQEPEEVAVTGSLIANSSFAAPTPVTALGSEEIANKAAGSVFEIIRNVPAFNATSGPTANSTGAQNASKANLNLRNLGSTRTLLLVNGKRFVADAPTNVVDSNLIPTGMIQRIDIVTGGASATYGSDAVAGVVNLILDKEFEGLKGDARFGISQYGDNIEFSPNLTWGTSLFGGKGHLTIGGDISISLGTKNMLSRSWGRLQPGVMSPSSPRAAGVPAQIIANGVVTSAYNASGLIVGCTVPGGAACPIRGIAFGENGSTYNFAPGTITGATEQIGGGDYGSFENPDQFLRGAFNRWATMARFDYDFGDGLQAYAQFNYGGLMTFNNSFGAQVPNFNRFTVYADNPFLPASIRTVMTARGITSFQYSASRQYDLKSIASRNRTDSMMGNMGIGGVFNLFETDWAWDADLGVGLGVFEPYIKNTPRTADFFASAYVVTGPNGAPMCGPVATNPYFNAQPAAVRAQLIANLSPGCVPYNIFGNNIEQNKAANAYFNSASNVENRIGLYTFHLGFSGSPLKLPAGDVAVAYGVDLRRDTINVDNCADCKKGALMNQNYSFYKGQIFVHEFYGEAEIPVLRGLPFIELLGVNAAIRNTEYSTSGNVTTWKAGFTWDIDENIRLRGTRSHDIRAPNLSELYNPGSEGNPNVQNKVRGTSGFIKSNTVGNLALKPESGETITGGFVFQPSWAWAEGLSISMDYFYIKMKDVISTVNIQTIMDDYAVKGSASIYAPFVTADPSNVVGVSRINVPQQNLNAQKTGGIDLEFDYHMPADLLPWMPGSLNFRAMGTWIDNFHVITPTQDTDSVGTINAPKLAFSFNLQHEWDSWTSVLNVKYQSNVVYSATNVGLDGLTPGTAAYNTVAARNDSINRNIWPEVLQFDTRFAYDIYKQGNSRVQAYLNIENITNKKPPIVAISLGGSPYDLIGRNFKVGVRFRY